MYQPLVPCNACRRHVRATDDGCPFCRHSRTPDTSPAETPIRRMSRAAAFAFMASVTGCHSDPSSTAITPDPVATVPKPAPKPEPVTVTDAGLVDDAGSSYAEYGAPVAPAYGGAPAPLAPKPPMP